MRDNAVLHGDYLCECSAFFGWAQGLQAHILFKEEDGCHIHYVWVYYLSEYMVCLDIYLSLVVQLRQSVVQHGVFLIGNPTSSIEELLEESFTTFSTIRLKAKLHLSFTVQILLRFRLFCKLQQVETRSLDLGHFSATFQWKRFPLHQEDNIGGL